MTKSKIFLYFCLSFVFGVFFESLIKIPLLSFGGFFILGIILAGIFWSKNPAAEPQRKISFLQGEQSPPNNELFAGQTRYEASKKIVVIGFCLMMFAIGGWRYLEKEQVGNLSQFNDKGRLALIGTIDDLPDRRATSQKLIINTEKIIVADKQISVSGLAIATTKLYPSYQYGDLLEIFGQLKEPENFKDPSTSLGASFDYKNYLAKSDIYSLLNYPEIKVLAKHQGSKIKSSLFWLKQKFESAIEKLLPEPQASFLIGLTLGEKKSLPENLTQAFQKTGTTHIVALSGYNISLVASFFMTIFGWLMLARAWRFWLAVLAIIFFTILTGASASVVRAAIMGILVLVARNQGRMYSIRNALVFAGATMIFLNPKIMRFDVGFQLSFLATAGLVWLTPVFEKWFAKLPKALDLKEILIATLAAQLAVLPLMLIYFGQLSLIAPLVNLAILILIPQTMLVGFVGGVIGMLWLWPAKIFGWLAWLYLTLELAIIKFFAGLPLSSVKMNWGWPFAIIYYLILIGLLYLFYNKAKKEILVEQYAEE